MMIDVIHASAVVAAAAAATAMEATAAAMTAAVAAMAATAASAAAARSLCFIGSISDVDNGTSVPRGGGGGPKVTGVLVEGVVGHTS